MFPSCLLKSSICAFCVVFPNKNSLNHTSPEQGSRTSNFSLPLTSTTAGLYLENVYTDSSGPCFVTGSYLGSVVVSGVTGSVSVVEQSHSFRFDTSIAVSEKILSFI